MVTETYRDTVITLREDENVWGFTANGRERTAPSLPKAREYIDNALDGVKSGKVKKWEPFEAWHTERHGRDGKVKVPSEAEKGYGSSRYFWIVGPRNDYRGGVEQKREKVSESYLKAATPENDALIAEIQEIDKQRDALDVLESEKRKLLAPIQIPVT
jgi:hypothetical protein